MQYGWMWKIPVGNRYGMGYVYNKDLISDDDVLAEAETKLNRKIDPIKFIDWEPAISEKIWHKNYITFDLIIMISLLTSTVSQAGDLFISYLKRKSKLKDTGNILP